MEEKVKVDKDNYKEIMLKRSIIICWILLGICFIVKLLGGDYFAIACENERFIKICLFCDKYYISVVFRMLSFISSSFLIMKCVDYNTSKPKTLLFIFMCFIYWCFKHLVEVDIIDISLVANNILDFVILYALIFFVIDKEQRETKIILKPLIAVSLLFLFSIISAFVKNIGIKGKITNSFFEGFIFMIDYYIMLVLTFLYSRRRCLKWEIGDGSRG